MTASIIKSKQRIRDYGEVFTPDFIVNQMLALVETETTRIESRFLEPACGDGNFLAAFATPLVGEYATRGVEEKHESHRCHLREKYLCSAHVTEFAHREDEYRTPKKRLIENLHNQVEPEQCFGVHTVSFRFWVV